MSERTCIVDGCDKRRHVAAGWCGMHYYRVKTHGSPEPELLRHPRQGLLCVIDGCERERYSGKHGWCKLHYDRWRTHGDPHKVLIKMPTDGSFSNSAAHKRVEAAKGKAKVHLCEFCGDRAAHWAYDHEDPDELDGGNLGPYSGDPSHYKPLCVPCHKRFDLERLGKARQS